MNEHNEKMMGFSSCTEQTSIIVIYKSSLGLVETNVETWEWEENISKAWIQNQLIHNHKHANAFIERFFLVKSYKLACSKGYRSNAKYFSLENITPECLHMSQYLIFLVSEHWCQLFVRNHVLSREIPVCIL